MRARVLPAPHPDRVRSLIVSTIAILFFAGCVTFRGPKAPPLPERVLRDGSTVFIVFDLGQADAMLVLHGGKTLLFDAGVSLKNKDAQKYRTIGDRLEELTGRRHLDYFVVSHYHKDHIGSAANAKGPDSGLFALLNSDGVSIDTLVDRGRGNFGPKGATQRAYENAVPLWIEAKVVGHHRLAKAGESLDMGPGLKVDIIDANGAGNLDAIAKENPVEFQRYPPSQNDYSVALKFTQNDFELFSGGDLTGESEHKQFGRVREGYNDIESKLAPSIGDVEVYRVNHHGSAHSSNPCFLSILRPEVSIFSTGDNSYGHPSPRVYEALKGRGRVLITGGADASVVDKVKDDIVGGEVDVVVAPDGHTYSVNGLPFVSKSEAEEAALPNQVTWCPTNRVEVDEPHTEADAAEW